MMNLIPLLLMILLAGGCSKVESPTSGGAVNAGRESGSAPISYDQKLRDLKGTEVVARGYFLEADVKGYPKLFEKTRDGRFFLVTFAGGVHLEKYLNRFVEVRGKVVEYPPSATAPDGLPQQGYPAEIFVISGSSIRDVP